MNLSGYGQLTTGYRKTFPQPVAAACSQTVRRGNDRDGGRPNLGWHVALWVAQALLCVAFGTGGFMKLTTPIDELAKMLVWPGDLPPGLIRFIGFSELAGAIGVVLPALTRIRPGLTPLAALGFVTVMALALVFHLTRGEVEAVPINVGLGALAAFVAWGRSRKAPIAPRA